jgi:dGTPase
MSQSGRAPYAADPDQSRGRLHPEPENPRRSVFQRDADRILHSTAFRRLKDKTQVFLTSEGDHYRTRLTHTLEVSRIARGMARSLRLDEDLAEAVALAHDLGHPPFGHAGERALDRAAAEHGGFDHNLQSLRAVTLLERRYAAFDGLNLTWETLEGLAKHNGPVTASDEAHAIGHVARRDLELGSYPSAEAQIAAIADDVAYDAHDIDDGLRAGLLSLDELAELPIVGTVIATVRRDYPDLERTRLIHETTRRLISTMIGDVVGETEDRLARLRPRSADDIRGAGGPVVGFTARAAEHEREIKDHLRLRVYDHTRVRSVMGRAEEAVARLFERYEEAPLLYLPPEWRHGLEAAGERERGRRIADFIAGMSDRYAIAEHFRLFDREPELG